MGVKDWERPIVLAVELTGTWMGERSTNNLTHGASMEVARILFVPIFLSGLPSALTLPVVRELILESRAYRFKLTELQSFKTDALAAFPTAYQGISQRSEAFSSTNSCVFRLQILHGRIRQMRPTVGHFHRV